MIDCFMFRDCVGRFEYSESRQPTEWENFPIHHMDPFWNAELFDERQVQDFSTDGFLFEVSGGYASDSVLLRAYRSAGGLMLAIKDARGHQVIWLKPSTLKAFRDYINTTK